jgi:hypothetical protein
MTDILAIDAATVSGWARGKPGEIPSSGSVRFGKPNSADYVVFGDAVNWFVERLKVGPVPDVLIIEALLPPTAMKGETTRAVRDRLCGLHGILKGIAHRYGIGEIATAPVGLVRQHFIGWRHARRNVAKRETMLRCRELGWPCVDDNAGDALALWHYAASLIEPNLALQVSPLFQRRAAQ